MLTTSRIAAANARATGAPTYAGMPCQVCASTTRYTSNRQCVECAKTQRKAAHKADPSRSAAQKRAYRSTRPDAVDVALARIIDDI